MNIRYVDDLLNKITMYRAMLYFLMILVAYVIVLALFTVIPYSAWDIIETTLVITIACLIFNWVFAKLFRVPANNESVYITAFILSLIITPGSEWLFLILAALFSQGSKYIINYRGKHIFNPAAIGVVLTLLVINQAASWWIGMQLTTPIIILGGLLVVRKIQRFDLILSFLVVYLAHAWANDYLSTIWVTPILFFTFVMLTEPLTSPTRRRWRIVYGALVALIFVFGVHVGEKLYSSPELALVLGNIFAFIISDRGRYKMILKEKIQIAPDTFGFQFAPNRKIDFEPGQYLEWTIANKKNDLRGNRRYFTIASSPTENHIDLGIKFYEKPSAFKQTLMALNTGEEILAGQLSGDFVLPKDQTMKLVFIAGGIGITPFRSMIKYLIDKKEKRDVVLFYAVNSESDIAYKEILEESKHWGVKVLYKTSILTRDVIANEVTDFKERKFYISGPRGMVVVFEKVLHEMGVPRTQIKIDFFPGYA